MKNKAIISVYILALAVALINSVFTVRDSVHFSMSLLPEGTEIYCSSSPNGSKMLKLYKINNSLGKAIRGEIVTKDSSRCIYWQTGIDDAEYSWRDEHTVIINGVPINAHKGAYDCRRGYSIFSEGSLEEIEDSKRNLQSYEKK